MADRRASDLGLRHDAGSGYRQGDVADKHAAIRKEIEALGSQIQSLKTATGGLASETQSLTRDSAQIRQTLAGGDADITTLREHQEEFSGRMDLLEKSIDDVRKGLDRLEARLTAIERYLDMAGQKAGPAPAAGAGNQTGEAPAGTDSDAAYQAALNSFEAEKFEQAHTQFVQFLAQYPQEPKAGHAQYWIGECLYYQGRYEQAILEYDKVVKNFATGDRVPFALYKEGICFSKLGDASAAKLLFQRVVQDFPDSSPAAVARIKLKAME